MCFLICSNIFTIAHAQNETDDIAITQDVQAKLVTNPTLHNKIITATTRDGVVILSGSLDTEAQASTAVEIAQSVPGVKDVNVQALKIRNDDGSQASKDAMTTAKVKGIFLKNNVSVFNIHVETIDGVVYLTGHPDNFTELSKAATLARSIKEVKKVDNKIKVKSAID